MDISITTSLARSFIAARSGRLARVVRVGEPLYLMMPLSGRLVSPPSVQWMRNGSDIPGATETPYIPTDEDVGENVLSVRGTMPDGTSFETQNAVSVRAQTTLEPEPAPEQPAPEQPTPTPTPMLEMIAAPSIGGSLVAGQEAQLDFGTWDGAEALVGTLLRDGAVYHSDLTPQSPVSWTTEDAGASMVLQVEARAGEEAVVVKSEPVQIVAPLAAPRRVGSLEDAIFDIESGDQLVETAQVFEGDALTFSVSGANATIDPATGVVSIPTDAPLAGVVVTVTATNAAGSDNASFHLTVESAGDTVASPDTPDAPGDSILESAVVASGKTSTPAYSDARGLAGRSFVFMAGGRGGKKSVPALSDGTGWPTVAIRNDENEYAAGFMVTYPAGSTDTAINFLDPASLEYWAVVEITQGTPVVSGDVIAKELTSGSTTQSFSLPATDGGLAFATGSAHSSTHPSFSGDLTLIDGTSSRSSGIYWMAPTVAPSVDFDVTVSAAHSYHNNQIIAFVLRPH